MQWKHELNCILGWLPCQVFFFCDKDTPLILIIAPARALKELLVQTIRNPHATNYKYNGQPIYNTPNNFREPQQQAPVPFPFHSPNNFYPKDPLSAIHSRLANRLTISTHRRLIHSRMPGTLSPLTHLLRRKSLADALQIVDIEVPKTGGGQSRR